MPTCLSCNTDNSLERKVCKSCGQALVIEEGKACSCCGTINGPFAKKCRKCSEALGRNRKKNNSNVHVKESSPSSNKEPHQFYEHLKSSYLYDAENDTFAKEKFTVDFSGSKIHFTLRDFSYKLEEVDDLDTIFNSNIHQLPDFIKENASSLLNTVFKKYGEKYNIRVLEDSIEVDEYLLAFANEQEQLAVSNYLPIIEHEIEDWFPNLAETCDTSTSYVSMYNNQIFVEFLDTMDRYQYRYEFVSGNGKEFIYKIGDENITIKLYSEGDSLDVTYLNKKLTITKHDREYFSILLLNWMMNIVIENISLGERMYQYFNKSKGMFDKMKNYFNKNLQETQYPLTDNQDVVLSIVSGNLIQFTFKELKTTITEPIHPNMPNSEFEKILTNYSIFAKNKDYMQYIKMMEKATRFHIQILDVSNRSCKIIIYTETTNVTIFNLNHDTTYAEVTKFISKVKFMDKVILD